MQFDLYKCLPECKFQFHKEDLGTDDKSVIDLELWLNDILTSNKHLARHFQVTY